MPSVKFFSQSRKVLISLCCSLLIPITVQASDLEITPMLGYTFSPELISDDYTEELSTTNEPNLALAFSWKDSTNGQGQILLNYISRDFTDNIDQSNHSFDTLYAHFNGVAFFKERNYITTVGMGVGLTYFNSDFDSTIYPSITFAVGTRYELSHNLAFITELRAYATLTKDDESVFCQDDTCVAHLNDAVWFDGQVAIGLAYSF